MDQCVPSFLEELAVAVPLEGGGSTASPTASSPRTMARSRSLRSQRAVRAASDAAVDCEAMPTMVIVDHSPAKVLKKSPPHDLDILFASYPDPSQGGIVPLWRAVPATVFADLALPLPTSDDWIVYEKESASVFAAAELATVENKCDGVEVDHARAAIFPVQPRARRPDAGLARRGTSTFYGGQMAASVLREPVRAARRPAGGGGGAGLRAFFDAAGTDDCARRGERDRRRASDALSSAAVRCR